MSGLSFRRATEQDAKVLREIAARTFIDTYGALVPGKPGLIEEYVRVNFTLMNTLAELADRASEIWLGLVEDKTVGYLKLVKETGPAGVGDPALYYLSRLYLLRDFQGKGLGVRFLTQAESIARAAGYRGLWLKVMRANVGAVRFYARHGFEVVGACNWVFDYRGELHVDEDDVMAKRFSVPESE